jgi:hypothetical protein
MQGKMKGTDRLLQCRIHPLAYDSSHFVEGVGQFLSPRLPLRSLPGGLKKASQSARQPRSSNPSPPEDLPLVQRLQGSPAHNQG